MILYKYCSEFTAFFSVCVLHKFDVFLESDFVLKVIQLTPTFDFFESVMRYFSYCSMLKIKLGMTFVSRRSFAYQERKREPI